MRNRTFGPYAKGGDTYPEKQGRPQATPVYDMGTGAPAFGVGAISGISVSNTYGTYNVTSTTDAPSNIGVLLVDASGGAVTVTLPDADESRGKWYTIKKVDSGGGYVKIYSDDLIDGDADVTITLQYDFVSVISSGATWYVIGGVSVKLNEILQDNLEKMVNLSEEIAERIKESNLHLGSMSGEDVNMFEE